MSAIRIFDPIAPFILPMFSAPGSIVIDGVTVQNTERSFFGGPPGRGCDGSARGRRYAHKRIWKFKTPPILKADADILIDYLRAYPWAQWFWMDEFGAITNQIKAYIDLGRAEPMQFASRYYVLDLTVSEQ